MIGSGPVSIMGAGPTGALLSLFLRRRGFEVTLYEGRPDPRGHSGDSGRSINLALADRGIHALKLAGVYDAIAHHLVPMRGRMVHLQDGGEALHLYGRGPGEVIYSVSRHLLNQALLEVAVRDYGVEVRFEHRLEDADFVNAIAVVHDIRGGRMLEVAMQPMLATDGAGSAMRRRLQAAGLIAVDESPLAHGYKELSVPAAADGSYRMARDALHIWPRGNFMLIALPNTGGSFTATLFLANHGDVSFAALSTPALVGRFLSTQFPDVYRLMPDCVAEFQSHPTGLLGTVYADRWSVQGKVLLVGDSAHAIVPFHGQGMNCCFEDCVNFDACLQRNADWESVFAEFFANRKPNTDAIAVMALENYQEMRERVTDPHFRLQQTLALELQRRHPQRFIPRYSMVMFHHEIPYHAAQTRGLVQTRLLSDLTGSTATLQDVDYEAAARVINRNLPLISAAVAAGVSAAT